MFTTIITPDSYATDKLAVIDIIYVLLVYNKSPNVYRITSSNNKLYDL